MSTNMYKTSQMCTNLPFSVQRKYFKFLFWVKIDILYYISHFFNDDLSIYHLSSINISETIESVTFCVTGGEEKICHINEHNMEVAPKFLLF